MQACSWVEASILTEAGSVAHFGLQAEFLASSMECDLQASLLASSSLCTFSRSIPPLIMGGSMCQPYLCNCKM